MSELTLVNIRGIRAERLFQQAVDSEPNLTKIQMEVHGMLNEEIVSSLAKFPNIMISNGHIDERSYFASYANYNRVSFLYDPEFFLMQSSGRLADAIVSGATLLVPRGTSLDDVLKEHGNGTSFDFDDESSLAHGLLSKPSIPRKVNCLPTNFWAAATILETIKTVVEKDEYEEESRFEKFANNFLDEFIWGALGFLRLIFALRRRLEKLISLKH